MKDQRDELDIIRKTAVRQMIQALSGKSSDSTVKDGKKVYIKKRGSFLRRGAPAGSERNLGPDKRGQGP